MLTLASKRAFPPEANGAAELVGLDQDRKRASDLEDPLPPTDLDDVLNDQERVVEETVVQSKAGISQRVLQVTFERAVQVVIGLLARNIDRSRELPVERLPPEHCVLKRAADAP